MACRAISLTPPPYFPYIVDASKMMYSLYLKKYLLYNKDFGVYSYVFGTKESKYGIQFKDLSISIYEILWLE